MWRLQRRQFWFSPSALGLNSIVSCRTRSTTATVKTSSTTTTTTIKEANMPGDTGSDYSTWDTSSLIARITELERQLHSRTSEHATTNTTTSSSQPPPSNARAMAETDQETARPPNKKLKKKEEEGGDITQTAAPNRPPKGRREMDPSKYHTRYIALKFAYLGQRYNGFEHANKNVTPLPTIEEELWKALRMTRLIFPVNMPQDDDSSGNNGLGPNRVSLIDWEGCQYSKAGRTDRGVSAFGQVVGMRVRSARPKHDPPPLTAEEKPANTADVVQEQEPVEEEWDDVADELPYINMLNRVLPEDIRVLAWCPQPPEDFDARFSCRERQYKYFFTQPAFSPTPGPLGFAPRAADGSQSKYREGWLDINAMQEAARHFEGVHDFRNFCKLDTSKQIENFQRIIFHSDIELVDTKDVPLGFAHRPGFKATEDSDTDMNTESPEGSSSDAAKVYVFSLKGSAFLWHQVRHMVAILFLVGQGFESPSIVPDLLDITKNPRKPQYEMASDAPLVLWDCIFPNEDSKSREDALEWVYAGDARQGRSHSIKGDGKFGIGGAVEGLWTVWRRRKIDEILAGSLLELAVGQGDQSSVHRWGLGDAGWEKKHRGQRVFIGADEGRIGGKYIPVMQKKKMDPVEVQNARWLAGKQRKAEQAANPSHEEA